jgi:hypothetical protein
VFWSLKAGIDWGQRQNPREFTGTPPIGCNRLICNKSMLWLRTTRKAECNIKTK